MKAAKGHLKKLDERSKRLVHLGVEKGTKAYRLVDPDTGKMYVSRDVIFEEQQSWVWEKSLKIKATPGMSFSVEGFDLDDLYNDEFEPEPQTPDQEYGSLQSTGDRTEESTQPINSPLGFQTSPQSTPINEAGTPNSPNTPNSPISPVNTPSTASSSTGGGAPKRFRLLSDLYENT
ncbi:zinc finger, CCHC-type containing protein, partial [Tanacetum coccineum]